MLNDKRLIITGVVRSDSIAYAVAEHAQLAGAEIVLTAFPRDRELTEIAAQGLPRPAPVLGVDFTQPDDIDKLAHDLGQHWGRVDGALHSIGFAPREALGGDFLTAPYQDVSTAFHTSAYSYAALARVVRELAPPDGAALVGLDFDASAAWPVYNWMGVCKAALESVNRYLARDLGRHHIRANLIAAGPLHTRAANGIPAFDSLLDAWEGQAPLTWDPHDAAPVADTACFLLSDLARAITGEIVHVDGGYHAMAAAPQQPSVGHDATRPQPTTTPTRDRLHSAFAVLSSHGITALPAVAANPRHARRQLHDTILQDNPNARGSYVFYTDSEDTHFSSDGHLQAPMTLHVSGNEIDRAVRAALNEVGLQATSGQEPNTLFLTPTAHADRVPTSDRA